MRKFCPASNPALAQGREREAGVFVLGILG